MNDLYYEVTKNEYIEQITNYMNEDIEVIDIGYEPVKVLKTQLERIIHTYSIEEDFTAQLFTNSLVNFLRKHHHRYLIWEDGEPYHLEKYLDDYFLTVKNTRREHIKNT